LSIVTPGASASQHIAQCDGTRPADRIDAHTFADDIFARRFGWIDGSEHEIRIDQAVDADKLSLSV
jgi:hypothetical protein